MSTYSKSDLPSEPFMVYTHGERRSDQLFCSLFHPQSFYIKSIPALCADSFIKAYCNGWFLLSPDYTQFWLWNSTISEDSDDSFIKLPPLCLKPTQEIAEYFLLSSPGDPNCMLLFFEEVCPSVICMRLGDEDKQWIEIPYANLISDFAQDTSERLRDCLSCNGNLYSFTTRDRLMKLDLHVDEAIHNLRIEVLCQIPEELTTMNTLGLVENMTGTNIIECCGELLFVCVVFGGKYKNIVTDVLVHKLDFDRMIWEKAHSLMGQAVFLTRRGASSCPAFGGGIIKADCVYFTFPPELGLYSFNVKDGCLSVHLPCENIPESLCCYPVIVVPHDVRLSCTEEKQGEVNKKENSTIIANSQREGITLSDLTVDSITEVLNCSSLSDYLNFRVASRDYHPLLLPKLQREQVLQKFETCGFTSHSSSPICLLLPTNDMTGFKFVDPVHGSTFHMSVPESLRGSVVRCSRNGWLLMCDEKSSMSFLNPFTVQIVKLKKSEICVTSCVMAFSSLPTSSDCIVVGCCAYSPTDSSKLCVLFAKMGEDYQWQYNELQDDSIFWLSNANNPLFYKGSFYVLGQDGNLSTLKYEEKETDMDLSWEVLREIKAPCRCKCFQQNFLVECDGKLLSIFVEAMGKWLKVFSLNFDKMCWEEVRSIGKYVIYVSPSSCVSKEASIVGTENRIYLPRFCGNSILYYSLETGKFHVNAEETLDSFYDTKEPLMATWIEAMF